MHEESAKVGEVDCNLRTFKMNRVDHIFLLESRQQHKAIDIADRSTSSASIIKVAWRWCFIVFTFFRARNDGNVRLFMGKFGVFGADWSGEVLHDTKTLVQWPWVGAHSSSSHAWACSNLWMSKERREREEWVKQINFLTDLLFVPSEARRKILMLSPLERRLARLILYDVSRPWAQVLDWRAVNDVPEWRTHLALICAGITPLWP